MAHRQGEQAILLDHFFASEINWAFQSGPVDLQVDVKTGRRHVGVVQERVWKRLSQCKDRNRNPCEEFCRWTCVACPARCVGVRNVLMKTRVCFGCGMVQPTLRPIRGVTQPSGSLSGVTGFPKAGCRVHERRLVGATNPESSPC